MEYQGLKYKTRGNADPKGKPRVYFCCHEEDFGKFFKPVTEEILSVVSNAAVWYYDPADGIPEDEEFLSDLSQMQLFVVPVTANFILKDSRARTVEFAFAREHHIPILPLMQEPGLEKHFNRICGDLQFLDRRASHADPTAIPYKEKLKTFLDSVIVSDETANKIRDAFEAYIFLSYRKKDRAYAQQVMRLIHQNEFCRDVAIWYDEFLTPGEDFNEAISQAMKKSSLFALVVTPSILEKPNYVMTTEYPEAKRSGKPVLPVEALKTNSLKLSWNYKGIGTAIQSAQLPERLKSALPDAAKESAVEDPVHDYLIGLAYLSGIDVEIDHEKALKLITSAAEAELPEAMQKLTDMYLLGDGVKRNTYTAHEWYVRYVKVLKGQADEDPSEENLDRLFNSLLILGNMETEYTFPKQANKTFEEMLHVAEKMGELGCSNAGSRLLLSYRKFGDISLKEGRTADAKELFRKSLELAEAKARSSGSADDRRYLMQAYERMGDICQSEEDLKEERKWRFKSLSIAEELAKETGTELERRNMIINYSNYGCLCMDDKDMPEAKSWLLKALSLAETLSSEYPTQKNRWQVSYITGQLGWNCKLTGDLSEAKEWFFKSYKLRAALAAERLSPENRRDLEVGLIRMEGICRELGETEEADEWQERKKSMFHR
ncbi:MAG: toll/interleukin-1 receptor domain-containing protein [Lachnospiraceae bacterium]|nr:toll/interleukin-1 receptor domain-containing protein [Lachnospiraceae bacterium]